MILNTVKLNVLKDALSPHLYKSEFLQTVFPPFLKEHDKTDILHFIFPKNDKSDSRAKTRFMDGNVKTVKKDNKPEYRRDYVNALKFIAFMLQQDKNVLEWTEFLKVNYPNPEYTIIRNIADSDAELYPDRFKTIILTENNPYFLMLFTICWSIFGEQIGTCNFKPSTEYLKTNASPDLSDDEAYFSAVFSNLQDMERIDLAYHSGYKWLFDRERADMLTEFLSNGGKLRVIVNSPKAAEKIGSHTRNPNRSYVGFKSCIAEWKKLLSKHPDSVELVISDLPLLHSYANFRFTNRQNSKMLIIFYTYNNPVIADNYHLHLTPASKEYATFEQEFEYLWSTNVNRYLTPCGTD
jgi:hypothetical protein